jgi:formylglycine-generating enzyme
MLPQQFLELVPLLIALSPLPDAVPAGTRFDALALTSLTATSELPAACGDGMVLVDGEHCPSLEYQCLRFVDESSPSCAEYARKPECRYNTVAKRFCIDRYEWPNRTGERPRVFVTWFEAQSSCESVGKRLCARSEWTLACEGPKRAPYPYGWERQPSPCNVGRSPIAFEVEDITNPRTRAHELERLWQGDPIGSHPDCVSAYGAFDMVGNVDEWTDNREEGGEQVATLNGGYWGPVRNTCRLTTKTHGPDFQFYQIGFRCCSDPQDGLIAPLPEERASRDELERRAGPEGWPIPAPERAAPGDQQSEPVRRLVPLPIAPVGRFD